MVETVTSSDQKELAAFQKTYVRSPEAQQDIPGAIVPPPQAEQLPGQEDIPPASPKPAPVLNFDSAGKLAGASFTADGVRYMVGSDEKGEGLLDYYRDESSQGSGQAVGRGIVEETANAISISMVVDGNNTLLATVRNTDGGLTLSQTGQTYVLSGQENIQAIQSQEVTVTYSYNKEGLLLGAVG